MAKSVALTTSGPGRKRTFSQSQRRRALKAITAVVIIFYTAITVFPFYVLLIRSFVATKDASDLHLWIPKTKEVSLDAQIGNLSTFYNLPMDEFKEAMGIPADAFLMSRTPLYKIAEDFGISEDRMKAYFAGYYTYNGWITMLKHSDFWATLGRSVLIVAASLVGLTILSIFTGYGLAGLRRKDQMFIYNLYLLQMVIPAMLIILPQFMLVQWLLKLFPAYANAGTSRWALQFLALIAINIKGGAFSTMIMTAAISAVPRELRDSAQIDGASHWQYIRYILLPLLMVPIASLIVIMLPIFWNLFLEPYVYLDPNVHTLLPLVYSIQGEYQTNFQMQYAAIFASVLPLVVVYLIFRRFFIEGVMAGAIKG
jgi:ABC-type glycerol-3-phosphate transport system permease component